MKVKNTIRIISSVLMFILLCLGMAGCTTNSLSKTSQKGVYDAIVPEGVTATLKTSEYDTTYHYILKMGDSQIGTIVLHTKSSYLELYIMYYRNYFYDEEITSEPLDDNGRRVLYYSYNGDSTKYAKVRATLHRGEEIIIINKDYKLPKGQTAIDETVDVPQRVAMYCRQGDTYYIVNISGFTEAKSDEWLLSFGLDLTSKTD